MIALQRQDIQAIQAFQKSIRYHVPCVIGGEVPLSQLEDRVAIGVIPSIHFRKKFTDEEISSFEDYIRKNNVRGVSFNLGPYNPYRTLEEYEYFLNTIRDLADRNPGYIERTAGIKYGSIFDPSRPVLSLSSPIDLESYESNYKRFVQGVQKISQLAQTKGISLEVENGPNPGFDYDPNGEKVKGDTHPRWGKVWYARPAFSGELCASATEIVRLLMGLENPRLELDLEHLVQTCQYGNIYNLEQARDGVLKLGDLTPEQKQGFQNYDLGIQDDNSVLFDFTNLTKKEEEFLEESGYTIRMGQPLVYKKRLDLVTQLGYIFTKQTERLINISSITPGFQVYQGFWDIIDGKKVLTVGSHMPGISRRYVKDQGVRANLTRQVRFIHQFAFDFMYGTNTRDVEIGPQLDDGSRVQYGGSVWREQVTSAIDQLEDNFRQASLKDILDYEEFFNAEPYYITYTILTI